MSNPAFTAPRARLPDAPALAVGVRRAVWLAPGEGTRTVGLTEAAGLIRAAGRATLVCHGRATARRLGIAGFTALDLLELFAFVRPARFCVPTVRGLSQALLVPVPETLEEEAWAMPGLAGTLLALLTASPGEDGPALARTMAAAGWPWARAVLAALGRGDDPAPAPRPGDGLRVWQRLKDWEDATPEPAPDAWPVEPVEARARLVRLVGAGGEPRPQQMAYASHGAGAFQPRDRMGEPRIVLAEAGTGIGKTLGYIAPATLWARKNRGTVWISTFTRNLQRQLDQELDRAYPDRREKATRVVVRKGRENLFCLLNFEEGIARLPTSGGPDTVALSLVARWATATRDGDMIGGDFPAWLADLLGSALTLDLTDTRGECIYSACRHFRRCFIERSIRKAYRAEIVVANHALVMVQAARGGDDLLQPTRIVFDEAHHLFEAADSALASHLSGRETAELRRWLRGGEDGRRSRRRGLRDRVGDLVDHMAEARDGLECLLSAAGALPGPGWRTRLEGMAPHGPAETFLVHVRQQVFACNRDEDRAYSLETPLRPPVPGLIEAAEALKTALIRFRRPLAALIRALGAHLDDEAANLDTATRARIEGLCRSLEFRVGRPVGAWIQMLGALASDETPAAFVDWLGIERIDGHEADMGFFRHWLDPTKPFAEIVLKPAHGVLLTSASLDDGDWRSGDGSEGSWAERRTGASHLPVPSAKAAFDSPFDYGAQTRILIVGDVGRDDETRVAAAYRELFLASGGGGLGLFTAISRLRAVHRAIAAGLEDAGIRLLAQHVDGMDTGTLIDIFRAEENSCLLGTDAVRDGVDVPGRSLRLIVLDRVPWPRPTLLHRARRDAMGGRAYDETLTRLKLKQAFGRLIRRADDRGVFVLLDRAMPTRLTGAFPDGVPIERLGLADAVTAVRTGLGR